ncbi:MAG: hypothetical protein ACREL9_07735, partial [Gemmatimonadales bacterium]
MTDARRWDGALEAAGVGLVVVVLHLLFRLSGSFLVGALNDDGVYAVLGKAIAGGEGYRSVHLVGEPVHTRYPPGLPLLLALPWALGGTLSAVRATIGVVNVAATGVAAALVWSVGRRRLGVSPWPLAVLAVGPLVLDPTIQYFNITLTEPYLVLGWVAGLALAYPLFPRATPEDVAPPTPTPTPTPTPPQLWRAAGVGLILAATTLFRTAGIALLPAMLVALLLHRRWKECGVCAVAMLIPLVAWEGLLATWIGRGPVSTNPDDLGYWRWLGGG